MSTEVHTLSTATLLQEFLNDCEQRGASKSTRDTYRCRLRHFAEELPELPTSPAVIDKFLRARGETPKKRGAIHRNLQIFYAYISRAHGIPTPVAPKGKTGRPCKAPKPEPITVSVTGAAANGVQVAAPAIKKSVQGGGYIIQLTLRIDPAPRR